MWWKLLQLSIVTAVAVSNIEYQWTPNPIVVAIFGGGAAVLVTMFLTWIFDLAALRRAKKRPVLWTRKD
jgi:hypothetical protein